MSLPSIEHVTYIQHILMYKSGRTIEHVYQSIKSLDIDEEMKQRIREKLRLRFLKEEFILYNDIVCS